MAYVNPNKQPGAYPSATTVEWTFEPGVNGVAYSVNGLPPVVSEYIAYDQLDPPNPFIAVTQDGNGNVVYDGGFPKFMNGQATNISPLNGVLDFSAKLQPDPNSGQFYYYEVFNNNTHIVKTGDVLVYDHYVFDNAMFGLDCTIYDEAGANPIRFRDYVPVIKDNADPATATHPMMCRDRDWKNKWITRTVPLESIVGKRLTSWTVGLFTDSISTDAREWRGQLRNARIMNGTTVAFNVMVTGITVNPTTPQDWRGGWTVTRKRYLGPGQNLNAGQIYFKNCLDFIANPAKVAASNKNILVLCDAATGSYDVKTKFEVYFNRVAGAGGYTCTYKDPTDYANGKLNPTLTELNSYAGMIFLGSLTQNPLIAPTGLFTDSAIQDILTFRKAGNGIFIITDHGVNIANIDDAYPVVPIPGQEANPGSFFVTANQLAVNFSAYFDGSFTRTPVNVGFLRRTYGDHVLYKGLTDDEFVPAGGSESRVVVKEVTFGAATKFSTTFSKQGKNTIDFLVRLSDGSVKTVSFMYLINGGKLVIFKTVNDDVVDTLNVDLSDRADIKIELDGSQVGSLIADIYRFDVFNQREYKIGEAFYDPVAGSSSEIFSEQGLYVNNADQIRVKITVPFDYQAALPITRWQYVIPGVLTRAGLTLPMKGRWPTNRPNALIQPRKLLEEIHATRPVYGLNKTVTLAEHFLKIIQYSYGELPKADGQAFAYKNATETTAALARLTPPTPKQVFDKWDRFNAHEYYPNGTPPAGNAATWYWDDNIKAAVQAENTTAWNGFVSDEEPETYELEVTVQSNFAGDDDFNGVIIAFNKDTAGVNRTLSVVLSTGSNGFYGAPWDNFSIVYGMESMPAQTATETDPTTFKVIHKSNYDNLPAGSNWNGAYRRLRIIRKGDIITVQSSKWRSTIYDANLTYVIDLNSDPILAQFKGGRKYGYGSLSQSLSFFKDIKFTGLKRNIVCDMGSDKVYSWNGTSWVIVPGSFARDVYGAPRLIQSVEKPLEKWLVRTTGKPVVQP